MAFAPLNPTKAVIDGLGIDAATVDGFEGHSPTKAAHDALGIDADTVDGQHASEFAAPADVPHVEGKTSSAGIISSVSWASAFSTTPAVVASVTDTGGGFATTTVESRSTTGASGRSYTPAGSGSSNVKTFIATDAT